MGHQKRYQLMCFNGKDIYETCSNVGVCIVIWFIGWLFIMVKLFQPYAWQEHIDMMQGLV
jgi:hypothetical protein